MDNPSFTPNPDYLISVLKKRNMTSRQLSKMIYGEATHRDVIKELQQKPDPRASTLKKISMALGISIDSMFDGNSTEGGDKPPIEGNELPAKNSDFRIDIIKLQEKNNSLNNIIEEKNKQIEELQKDKAQLNKTLDMVLNFYHNAQNKQ